MRFWRAGFAPRCAGDEFDKKYAYNVRYNYAREGKRTDYTPYSCLKIISTPVPKALGPPARGRSRRPRPSLLRCCHAPRRPEQGQSHIPQVCTCSHLLLLSLVDVRTLAPLAAVRVRAAALPHLLLGCPQPRDAPSVEMSSAQKHAPPNCRTGRRRAQAVACTTAATLGPSCHGVFYGHAPRPGRYAQSAEEDTLAAGELLAALGFPRLRCPRAQGCSARRATRSGARTRRWRRASWRPRWAGCGCRRARRTRPRPRRARGTSSWRARPRSRARTAARATPASTTPTRRGAPAGPQRVRVGYSTFRARACEPVSGICD